MAETVAGGDALVVVDFLLTLGVGVVDQVEVVDRGFGAEAGAAA